MGLKTAYSDDVKQTQNALMKQYTYEASFFVYAGVLYSIYHVMRHCTKQYSYVGLTESAAKSCASDKVTKYTRTYTGWKVVFENDAVDIKPQNYTRLAARVQAVHDQGDMWHTDIQVDETEDVWTFTLPANLASLFDETRDYDE